MERPQWSTLLKWERIATHFLLPLGGQWSRRRPSHCHCFFHSLPPRSPDPGAPRCEKQATAVDGPDTATTPRNTHPTLQSGRCSRDIACLIGRGGLLLGSLPPPLLPRLCHRAPLLICTPFPRPRLRTPSPSSPRAPASYLYVAFPCGETRPRFPGLGTLHHPQDARFLLPLITSLAGQAVRSWPGQAFRAWFHRCCADGSLEPRRTLTPLLSLRSLGRQ